MKQKINHDEMLELGRKFTPAKHNFSRIHAIKFDKGRVKVTFNKNFLSLSDKEVNRYIDIPKIIYDKNIYGWKYPKTKQTKDSIWQYLRGLVASRLENEPYIEIIQDLIKKANKSKEPFAVYLFYGTYDVPKDAKSLFTPTLYSDPEIVETMPFVICAICPLKESGLPKKPISGFMYPSFIDRTSDYNTVTIINNTKLFDLTKILK